MAAHLLWPGRGSTDADVLVPFAEAKSSLSVLVRHGWTVEARFANSSAFEHSANLHHETWGYVDLHRTIPGFRLDPDEAFDVLWSQRYTAAIAGIPCEVPSVPAQILILLLHAGRSPSGGRGARDVEHVWSQADAETRAEVSALVVQLRAELGFDAAFGRLDRHRDERSMTSGTACPAAAAAGWASGAPGFAPRPPVATPRTSRAEHSWSTSTTSPPSVDTDPAGPRSSSSSSPGRGGGYASWPSSRPLVVSIDRDRPARRPGQRRRGVLQPAR